jgi:hypothetical protein
LAATRAAAVAGVICAAAVALAAIGRSDGTYAISFGAVIGVILVAAAGITRFTAALWIGLLALGAADVGALVSADSRLDPSVAIDGALLFFAAELVMARVEGAPALSAAPAARRWLAVRAAVAAAGACAGLLAIALAGAGPQPSTAVVVIAAIPVLVLAVALRVLAPR